MGAASADSPVLVTANYKLTFDTLRRELAGVDVWVLVLDTRGVNVWCAAGKNLFSHDELALRVQRTGLERVVRHRRLILPQLAATGVSARQVKKKYGKIALSTRGDNACAGCGRLRGVRHVRGGLSPRGRADAERQGVDRRS